MQQDTGDEVGVITVQVAVNKRGRAVSQSSEVEEGASISLSTRWF